MSAEGRVEQQKLNQTTALLLFGLVFGVQLDFTCHKKRGVPGTCRAASYKELLIPQRRVPFMERPGGSHWLECSHYLVLSPKGEFLRTSPRGPIGLSGSLHLVL